MDSQERKKSITQADLDELIQPRLKRERTTTNRRRASELQDAINQAEALAEYLRDLQRRWTDGQAE